MLNRNIDTKKSIPNYDEYLKVYVDWLIAQHSYIKLPRKKSENFELKLESVYVGLRGETSPVIERIKEMQFTKKKLQEMFPETNLSEISSEEYQELMQQLMAKDPYSKSFYQRDLHGLFEKENEIISLGEAFRRYRQLVILGDPGSGKTTLAQWITLKLILAFQRKDDRVTVPANQVDQEVKDGDIDLGPVRFPILIQASNYIQAKKSSGRNSFSLSEFIGSQSWKAEYPLYKNEPVSKDILHQIMIDFVNNGKVVLIIDGLDETEDRNGVMQAVKTFVSTNIPKYDKLPCEIGGNQVIITSRIAGYYYASLLGDFTHVTIERMSKESINQFSESWFLALCDQKKGNEKEYLEKAKKFQEKVHDPKLEEVATNPLLITVLITIFSHKSHIPEKRVQLYDEIIQFLVVEWNEKVVPPEKVLEIHKLKKILSPIATYMNDNCDSGLIYKGAIKSLLTKQLVSNDIDPNSETFLNILVEKLGILMERGDGAYAFLHLTFQEYLAVMNLMEGSLISIKNTILQKISNPRWRETIVLALSYASSNLHWPQEDFESLLSLLLESDNTTENPYKDLLPRLALLITTLLDDIQLPSSNFTSKLIKHLFSYYSQSLVSKIKAMQKTLAQGILRVAENGYRTEVCSCIKSFLYSKDYWRISHAASLINDMNLIDIGIAKSLIEVYDYDSEELGFPIDIALRKMVSPKMEHFSISVPYPSGISLKELKDQLKQTTDSVEIMKVKQNIQIEERKFHKEKIQYEQRKSVFNSLINGVIKLPPQIHLEFPKLLSFKDMMKKSKQYLINVLSNPKTMQVVISLFGGYSDLNTPQLTEDYYQLNNYIGSNQSDREALDIIYAKKDTKLKESVYFSMMAELECNPKFLLHEIKPQFQLECIYRSSSLTEVLMFCIRKPDNDMIAILTNLLQSHESNDSMIIDATVALVSAGEDIMKVMRHLKGKADLLKKTLSRMSSIWCSLRDTVVRSRIYLGKILVTLLNNDKLTISHRMDIFKSTINTLISSGSHPLDLINLLDTVICSEIKFHLIGEYLTLIFNGHITDLSQIDKILPNDEPMLIKSILLASTSEYKYWEYSPLSWNAREWIEPSSQGLVEVILALKGMHPSNWKVFDLILSKLEGSTPENDPRQLLWRSCRLGTVSYLKNDGWMNLSKDILNILEDCKKVSDPFIQSLICGNCLQYSSKKKTEIFEAGWQYSDLIINPVDNFQAKEFLLLNYHPSDISSFANKLLDVVRNITNPENRSVSLLRLSFWYSNIDNQKEILKEALDAILTIDNEAMRAEMLRKIRPILSPFNELLCKADEISFSIIDIPDQNKSFGFYSYPLQNVTLQTTAVLEVWCPLVVSCSLLDVFRHHEFSGFNNTFLFPSEINWIALALNSNNNIIDNFNTKKNVWLTSTAALVIKSIVNNNEIDNPRVLSIIPKFSLHSLEVVPYLFILLQNQNQSNSTLSICSAILLAEQYDISDETIPSLAQALTSQDNLLHHRAFNILHASAWKKQQVELCCRNTSKLGFNLLMFVGKMLVDNETRPAFALVFSWLLQTARYDSIEIFKELVECARNEEKAALKLLKHIEFISTDLEAELLSSLQYSKEIAVALLKSSCVVAERCEKTKGTTHARHEFFLELNSMISSIPSCPSFQYLPSGAVGVAYAAHIDSQISPINSGNIQERLLDILKQSRLTKDAVSSIERENIAKSLSKVTENTLLVNFDVISSNAVKVQSLGRQYPVMLEFLVCYLESSLRDLNIQEKIESIIDHLFVACSALAQQMPQVFCELVGKYDNFSSLLQEAAQKANSFVSRQAAIFMLGIIGKCNERTAQSLLSCLHDVYYVCQTALDVPMYLTEIEESELDELEKYVESEESLLFLFSASQVLWRFLLSPKIKQIQQSKILNLFLNIVKRNKSLQSIQLAYFNCQLPPTFTLQDYLISCILDSSGISLVKNLKQRVKRKITKIQETTEKQEYLNYILSQFISIDGASTHPTQRSGETYFNILDSLIEFKENNFTWETTLIHKAKHIAQYVSYSPQDMQDLVNIFSTVESSKNHHTLLVENGTVVGMIIKHLNDVISKDNNTVFPFSLKSVLKRFPELLLKAINLKPLIGCLSTKYLILERNDLEELFHNCCKVLEIILLLPQLNYLEDVIKLAEFILCRITEFSISLLNDCDILIQLLENAKTKQLSVVNQEVLRGLKDSVLLCVQNPEKASELLDQYLKSDPSNVMLLHQRASIFMRSSRYNDAIADLTTILHQYPDNIWTIKLRGECYYQHHHYKDAASDFKVFLHFLHDDEIIFKHGLCSYNLGDYRKFCVDYLWCQIQNYKFSELNELADKINVLEVNQFFSAAKKLKGWSSSSFLERYEVNQFIETSEEFGLLAFKYPEWEAPVQGMFYSLCNYGMIFYYKENSGETYHNLLSTFENLLPDFATPFCLHFTEFGRKVSHEAVVKRIESILNQPPSQSRYFAEYVCPKTPNEACRAYYLKAIRSLVDGSDEIAHTDLRKAFELGWGTSLQNILSNHEISSISSEENLKLALTKVFSSLNITFTKNGEVVGYDYLLSGDYWEKILQAKHFGNTNPPWKYYFFLFLLEIHYSSKKCKYWTIGIDLRDQFIWTHFEIDLGNL